MNYFRASLLLALGIFVFVYYSEDSSPVKSKRSLPATRCKNDGVVALTFDDGPSPITRDVVLSLRPFLDYGLRATFHVSTEFLHDIKVNAFLKLAMDDGHLIGLRYTNNLLMNPSRLTEGEFKQELARESNAVKAITGYHPKYIRFNEKWLSDRTIKFAQSMGFVVTGWNMDLEAANYGTNDFTEIPLKIANGFLSVAPAKGSYVVFAQDIVPAMGLAARSVAQTILASGYEAVSLDKCLQHDIPFRTDEQNIVTVDKQDNEQISAANTVPISGFFVVAFITLQVVMMMA